MPTWRETLPDICLRIPTARDQEEVLAMNQASQPLHHPWIFPPTSPDHYRRYLARIAVDAEAGYLICQAAGRIVGVATVSNIVRGVFQNGYLSYYGSQEFSGGGWMTAGLAAVLDDAFGRLQLHRVEANIQPGNLRSKQLVERCGFEKEGFSPKYLFIDGQWRDHERWALRAEQWQTA